jgi:deoxyribodipyrimidine photo-lyase
VRDAIVLFTRDLRVHHHPAPGAAVELAGHVAPLFVLDHAILERFGVPNRAVFLRDALRDLGAAMRERGGMLAIREGDVVEETMRVAREVRAEAIFVTEDVSAYARAREQRLRRACAAHRIVLRTAPGTTVIPAGELAPESRDQYRVFSPYWRRWRAAPRRSIRS